MQWTSPNCPLGCTPLSEATSLGIHVKRVQQHLFLYFYTHNISLENCSLPCPVYVFQPPTKLKPEWEPQLTRNNDSIRKRRRNKIEPQVIKPPLMESSSLIFPYIKNPPKYSPADTASPLSLQKCEPSRPRTSLDQPNDYNHSRYLLRLGCPRQSPLFSPIPRSTCVSTQRDPVSEPRCPTHVSARRVSLQLSYMPSLPVLLEFELHIGRRK
jgi:hypothetical protein